MKSIKNIDKELTILLTQLENAGVKQKFKVFKSFKLTKSLNPKIFDTSELECEGIYLFEIYTGKKKAEIEEWKINFTKDWDVKRLKNMHVPTSKIKRLKEHQELKEWMPLYMGKSAKISARLKEHLTLTKKKTTFALKLLIRKEIHNQKFRLSYIRLDVDNYSTIAPLMESILRKKINPIVGKQ
jgi:hypothetical protein